MTDYILLAAAITLAVPYGYLTFAILVVQPRLVSSYIAAGLMLLCWPTCIFMSFMQAIPVIAMVLWWWIGDFSGNADVSIRRLSARALPTGLKYLALVTLIAGLGAIAYSWYTYQSESHV